jgi:predicted house-cleaning noncanonical NTP pyrophosphatase (MazG superfamily)
MTIKIYNKLVRDKVVEQAEARGLTVVTRVIEDDDEYLALLLAKLVEEARELQESLSVEEAADVMEVLMAIIEQLTTLEHAEVVRQEKARIRGSYGKRIFLESVEEP